MELKNHLIKMKQNKYASSQNSIKRACIALCLIKQEVTYGNS